MKVAIIFFMLSVVFISTLATDGQNEAAEVQDQLAAGHRDRHRDHDQRIIMITITVTTTMTIATTIRIIITMTVIMISIIITMISITIIIRTANARWRRITGCQESMKSVPAETQLMVILTIVKNAAPPRTWSVTTMETRRMFTVLSLMIRNTNTIVSAFAAHRNNTTANAIRK